MTAAAGHAVVGVDEFALARGLGPRSEIKFDVFPGVAAPRIDGGAQRRTWLVAAVHHAIFATAVLGDSIDDPVFVPFDLLEHLLVRAVVSVRHQVAWALPAGDITRRD